MEVEHDENWTGYTVLSSVFACSNEKELLALGNSAGRLYILELVNGKLIKKLVFEILYGRKIMSIQWLRSGAAENAIYIICTCEDGSMVCKIIVNCKQPLLQLLFES